MQIYAITIFTRYKTIYELRNNHKCIDTALKSIMIRTAYNVRHETLG